MLQKLYLNLASLNLINQLISQLPEVKSEDIYPVRTIRRSFEVRKAEDEIEKLEDERHLAFKRWEKTPEAERGPRPKPFSWYDLLDTKPKAFTVDEYFIGWLKEKLDAKNWTKARSQVNGQLVDVDVSVSPAQIEAIGDLLDALKGAEIVNPPKESE